MFGKAIIATLAALLLASPVAAQFHEETLRISVTDVTLDQDSAVIYRPLWAKGMLIFLVTSDASGVLATDIDIVVNSPALGATQFYSANCPSGGGITGDGTTLCTYLPVGVVTVYEVPVEMVHLPMQFIIRIDESSSETASYNLYTQWVH
jgi:hypothetical protein